MSGDSARSIDTARVQAVADAFRSLCDQHQALLGMVPCRLDPPKLPQNPLTHLVARVESIDRFLQTQASECITYWASIQSHAIEMLRVDRLG